MTWDALSASGSFSDSALTGASGFAGATTSSTTARNFSRFLAYSPFDSSFASGGIDFSLTVNNHAPFILSSSDSLYILSSADSRF